MKTNVRDIIVTNLDKEVQATRTALWLEYKGQEYFCYLTWDILDGLQIVYGDDTPDWFHDLKTEDLDLAAYNYQQKRKQNA